MPEQPLKASERTVYEVLRDAAAEDPDRPALSYMGERTSYGKLLSQVDRVSVCLSERGVVRSDCVSVCLHNCPEAVVAFYAANRLGAVAAMVHPLSSSEDVARCVEDTKCKVAFVNGASARRFSKAMRPDAGCGLVLIPAPGEEDRLPGTESWEGFLREAGHGTPYERRCSPDDPAAILYTGGTTGPSKGAVISSTSFNALAAGMKELSGLCETDQKMLSVLPLFHGFGLCTGIHLPVLHRMETILVPRFSAESVMKAMAEERPGVIFGVPTVFERILEKGVPPGLDLSFLTGLFCGGDAMPAEARRSMDRMLAEHGCNARIRIGYGCTECLSAVTITREDEARDGSVGVPLPGCEVSIAPMEGQPSGDGAGEICVRGQILMTGYLNRPEETAEVLRRHDDGKVWLHTGDVGRMDEDGSLVFLRRAKRVIVTSGYNVYPSELERCLDSDPRVKASCVVGIPDSLRIASVKAFIILKDGVEKSVGTIERIKARLAEMVPAYALPREFVLLDAFPRTMFGKVSYKDLENDPSYSADVAPRLA